MAFEFDPADDMMTKEDAQNMAEELYYTDQPERYNLADNNGFRKMNLSAKSLTEDGDSILVLGGKKPEGLENQELYLRYSKERGYGIDPPLAFITNEHTFHRDLKSPDSEFSQNGWKFKVHGDKDGNKTRKKYYVEIENTKDHNQYVGIPITENHLLGTGTDANYDRLLIVDKRSFDDNPNLDLSLNHQRVKVKDVDGHWAVAKDDLLAGRIKLSGNTIGVNNPEEIYLLTEKELAQYNSKGGRKGWSEEKIDEPGLRIFVKAVEKNGNRERVESRCAKEIMISQEVDGKVTPVKHYLLSDKATLESIRIMESVSKKEEMAKTPESSALSSENHTQDEVPTLRAEAEDLPKSVNTSEFGKSKAKYSGLALAIASKILKQNKGTLSVGEKSFLDKLNEIGNDPEEIEKLMKTIETSREHNIISSIYALMKNDQELQDQNQNAEDNKGQASVPDKSSSSVGGAEAAFGAASGAVSGLIQGGYGAVKSVAGGAMAAVGKIVENNHKRKEYRLEHPEVIEQEKAASKERLMVTRRARAEDSNSMLDAKLESVLGSKQFIDEYPAVQQMYNIIEDDPTQKNELEGWMENAAVTNPVFAEHLKNVKKNAGGVARGLEKNLQLNSLAGEDVGKRKTQMERFNESFKNDPLADVLLDPGGEQGATIKESITKAINNIMKILKDMMLRLVVKKKAGQDESAGQSEGSAPAMSR